MKDGQGEVVLNGPALPGTVALTLGTSLWGGSTCVPPPLFVQKGEGHGCLEGGPTLASYARVPHLEQGVPSGPCAVKQGKGAKEGQAFRAGIVMHPNLAKAL